MILSMMLFTKPHPPAERELVDSPFIYPLKMTYCYWILREHCFYRHRTCHLFLRVCLRDNSDANRRDFCHHRLCLLPCLTHPFLQKGDPIAENDRCSNSTPNCSPTYLASSTGDFFNDFCANSPFVVQRDQSSTHDICHIHFCG